MKDLTGEDVRVLKEIKALIQSSISYISPEVRFYLYDNVYLPLNDLLVAHGQAKPDNGELS